MDLRRPLEARCYIDGTGATLRIVGPGGAADVEAVSSNNAKGGTFLADARSAKERPETAFHRRVVTVPSATG